MGRELYFGRVGSVFDARIARRGFDALLDDPTDRSKISFAASQPNIGKIAETGTVTNLNTWASFAQSYAAPPQVEIVIRRGSNLLQGHVEQLTTPADGGYYQRAGTLYVAVVEQTRLMITRPANWPAPVNLNDVFQYFVVA